MKSSWVGVQKYGGRTQIVGREDDEEKEETKISIVLKFYINYD